MSNRLLAPASYVQGRDVLSAPQSFRTLSAETAVILGGTTALESASEALVSSLEAVGITVAAIESGVDRCTHAVIDELAEQAESVGADLIVGVGGGVALDTSKAVAEKIGATLATVPTIASTDAPCSSVAVVYEESGDFAGYVHRDTDPDLVVVDTAIIADAPTRFLQYGMGDAFATRFEAEAVERSRARTHAGGRPTGAAVTLAQTTFENLANNGELALASSERNAVTPAFESIVETNTLLSGMGFESGGLAAAHAFGKGFSTAGTDAPHGLLIAFSTIAQLVLENREPGVITEALDLYHTLGLDRRLADFDVDDELVELVAEYACKDNTTMSNEPVDVDPADAAAALRTADERIARY
ncbi:Glycerol dehydrogenase or related enzyme [Halanaeroarchaeum sp. HSR-CO]|uniref:glycerol dehydrogenase n=1 Tax=Halanaeroarchaeum sp. HSR-CO TaxID=2866382 RepID=UPI00217CCD95|nr:glycerol dehydrogenase [Halanaeroarchaeum sp. HSR-CO]UWG47094.1 Glycerol dehydrogenase or related enzyme [Halanaeroarchaeum sp. HSR-CO]